MLGLLAAAALEVETDSGRLAVGAAAELVRVATAAFEVRAGGFGVPVRTATVRSMFAATAGVIGPCGVARLVGATAERCILAVTTF